MLNRVSRIAALSTAFIATLTLSLVSLFALSAPAQAATISSVSVTSTGSLTAGGVNTDPIVITYTQLTAMPANRLNSAWVGLMGATWVTDPNMNQCGSLASVTGTQPDTSTLNVGCNAGGGGEPPHQMIFGQSITQDETASWPAGTVWTFTFEAGTVNLPYAGSLSVSVMTMVAGESATIFDTGSGSIDLSGYIPPAPDPAPEPDPGALPETGSPAEGTALVALLVFGYGIAFMRAEALRRRREGMATPKLGNNQRYAILLVPWSDEARGKNG